MYILQSVRFGKYYIGSTNNIERRIKEHRSKKSEFTKLYASKFNLVFCQEYEDVHMARLAEIWIKKQKSRVFIERIIKEGELKKLVE